MRGDQGVDNWGRAGELKTRSLSGLKLQKVDFEVVNDSDGNEGQRTYGMGNGSGEETFERK